MHPKATDSLRYRRASMHDCALLADLNHQLIRDEGHDNPMTVPELESRMRSWLHARFTALIFEDQQGVAGYAVFQEDEVRFHLRHFFIVRHRRHQGLGTAAVRLLFRLFGGAKRVSVDVLSANTPGVAFWRSMGFDDYCLTMQISPKTSANAQLPRS